jgi:hypothetical protein
MGACGLNKEEVHGDDRGFKRPRIQRKTSRTTKPSRSGSSAQVIDYKNSSARQHGIKIRKGASKNVVLVHLL